MDILENVLKITKDYYQRYGKVYHVFVTGSARQYYNLSDYVVSSAESGPSLWLIQRKY